jgi:long-chain acyl-CoA synthetase
LFHAAGMPLLEAYGLTECTVPVAANRPSAFRLGSVGIPFAENEIRLDDDGEVLIRGPAVHRGEGACNGNPARFTTDGFYRTGDLGEFRSGFLYLTGRKSELIKTSTGRRISPAKVEAVYQESPLIEQMVVIGNGRKDLVALIVPNRTHMRANTDQELRRLIGQELARLEGRLAPYERVHAFALLSEPFSVEHGDLTPTWKLRRTAIERRFAPVIAQLSTAEDEATVETMPARQLELAGAGRP